MGTVTYQECFIRALISRIITVLLMILSDALLSDHEPGDDVAKFGTNQDNSLLKTFVKWDAAHYLNIAKNGYETEQSFVFLPVYPYAIRFLVRLLKYITGNYVICIT